MIEIEQRRPFDCMTAAIASIFECAYEDVPLLCDDEGEPVDQWLRVETLWLRERGWWPQNFHYNGWNGPDPQRCPWRWPGYWIAGVKSPRYDGDHSVVMFESEIVWDPHPKREMGHLGFTTAEVFMPLDVSKFSFAEAA